MIPIKTAHRALEPLKVEFLKSERLFLLIIGLSFVGISFIYTNSSIAMWVGFMLAGYSTIANDSIQTIGTFLASNHKRPWWLLWMYIGGVFVLTILVSWFLFDGDVSYQRLTAKGFETAPTNFSYLQVAAPLFLLVITRARMPVSTTFLILSCFTASASAIQHVLLKSLSGYFVAFFASLVVWGFMEKHFDRWFTGTANKSWVLAQWVSTTVLWVVWLMQDAANIAVYLPRKLSFPEVMFFVAFIFFGLGLLFFLRGDRIQQIVTEKSNISDIRAATIVDFIYGLILLIFQVISVIPMSTTWVFIGLLGGRELAMTMHRTGARSVLGAVKMIGKDVSYAGLGLLASVILAASINPVIKEEILRMVGF